ncbi:MAG: RHS repeat-associated core domain-containing protein [Planctomycetota bacterium]
MPAAVSIIDRAGYRSRRNAAANPFRGSTKRFDPETGSPQRIAPSADLSDFGMRYYSATLGRWINRDPIGDFATANLVRHSESRRRRTFSGLGGANVYAYVGNNPTNRTDYLGRRTNAAYSGVAFGSPTPPIAQPFGYNDRNELISSSRGVASWGYAYDPIGNRRTYTTAGPVTATHTSNVLNQYERWRKRGRESFSVPFPCGRRRTLVTGLVFETTPDPFSEP